MKLYEVIGGVLDVDPSTLSDESNALNTPNWDSLKHIELMLAVETAFCVRFSMAELVSMQNLADMKTLLVSKGVSPDGETDTRLTA